MQVTIGGERLHSGNKMKVNLREYDRSTHDQSYIMRTTAAMGTLIPFLQEVGLPGTTFDIELDAYLQTHPTIGPMLGSAELQLDIYEVPIRLYQAALHMNMLGIGRHMETVYLPQIAMSANRINETLALDGQQINPSSIFAYLDIVGLGQPTLASDQPYRKFNALGYLAYWDIYKNYYSNKQEEIGAMIHTDPGATNITLSGCQSHNSDPDNESIPLFGGTPVQVWIHPNTYFVVTSSTTVPNNFDFTQLKFEIEINTSDPQTITANATEIFNTYNVIPGTNTMVLQNPKPLYTAFPITWNSLVFDSGPVPQDVEPNVVTFPLSNIDDMRLSILQADINSPFEISASSPAPYGTPLHSESVDSQLKYSKTYSQEGLALKTYKSDLFNNWISTEWIDGPDGVSAVTAVDTSAGNFTIDELNLKAKIYDMLNRIAISDGTYDTYLDVTYTHERIKRAETPIYAGGLQKNIVFQEVVSTAGNAEQPLGTLGGRGLLGQKHHGGDIVIKIHEPSIILGIASITPNIDYSQGNSWIGNLKTMADFHKPALDEIGFQDLITDQMAWWDTQLATDGTPTFKSAGKQPAWTNYMTNVNKVRGNFAIQSDQMWMVMTRRYNPQYENIEGSVIPTIADLTTYIDPVKFNYIFADTRRDAQNYWLQIGVKMTTRRKMSGKIMPNL